jgi:hypothetical protein
LFDTGKVHLRPVLNGFYGLEFLQGDTDVAAQVFLTGKNFHPTLTHVIVGGAESHSSVTDQVEVISRELLRVKVGTLNSKLSAEGQFDVRVGTPAGVSNNLIIDAGPQPPPEPTSGFDWAKTPIFTGWLERDNDNVAFNHRDHVPEIRHMAIDQTR